MRAIRSLKRRLGRRAAIGRLIAARARNVQEAWHFLPSLRDNSRSPDTEVFVVRVFTSAAMLFLAGGTRPALVLPCPQRIKGECILGWHGWKKCDEGRLLNCLLILEYKPYLYNIIMVCVHIFQFSRSSFTISSLPKFTRLIITF